MCADLNPIFRDRARLAFLYITCATLQSVGSLARDARIVRLHDIAVAAGRFSCYILGNVLIVPVLSERGNQFRALVHVSDEFGCDINIAHNEDNDLSGDRQFIHL
jgi:hypothetical protein